MKPTCKNIPVCQVLCLTGCIVKRTSRYTILQFQGRIVLAIMFFHQIKANNYQQMVNINLYNNHMPTRLCL
ncbi:hypothetical protein CDL12_16155 [Handroanthus impetiginosus]|uniref:Uncharacterized protein n=1 Tax=Handroanthus impetiginosus TaxID=429701 RepID=A0A2G9H152_9LAMI|nr:hypothetical protein CDL12_16155 [Handroanthus impetiginosus]